MAQFRGELAAVCLSNQPTPCGNTRTQSSFSPCVTSVIALFRFWDAWIRIEFDSHSAQYTYILQHYKNISVEQTYLPTLVLETIVISLLAYVNVLLHSIFIVVEKWCVRKYVSLDTIQTHTRPQTHRNTRTEQKKKKRKTKRTHKSVHSYTSIELKENHIVFYCCCCIALYWIGL